MRYGQNNESIITDYLDTHFEGGIKQTSLDRILDLLDEYVAIVGIKLGVTGVGVA